MDNTNGKGRKPEESVNWGKIFDSALWDSIEEEEEQEKKEEVQDGS